MKACFVRDTQANERGSVFKASDAMHGRYEITSDDNYLGSLAMQPTLRYT